MSHHPSWKRKEDILRLVLRPVVACLLFTLPGCATGAALRLVPGTLPVEDGRRYRLFLYGGLDPNDFETVAVLDRQDDRFLIVSHTGTINVRLLEGLTITEAQAEANRFLGRNNFARGMETKAISGPDSQVIGYEIRSHYPLSVGHKADDLDTSYLFKPDNRVVFYVYYPPEIGGGANDFPGLTRH